MLLPEPITPVPEAFELNPKTPHLSKELRKVKPLSSNDQKDIISFLLTLTDKEFLYNPRYQFPR